MRLRLQFPHIPVPGRVARWAVGVLGLVALGLAAASWSLTASLEPGDAGTASRPAPTPALPPVPIASRPELPAWPESRLEGPAAKELLLRILEAVDRSFRAIPTYTVSFRKQERINGKLLPEQTYLLKVRQEPFAVYMKGIHPAAGRELIYAEGYHDNHVIGHPAGLSRLLVPRLKLPPDHPMILAESRHPMDQAGLGNLIRKLVGFRRKDLEEGDEVTVLDRVVTPEGKAWLRSTHVHRQHRSGDPWPRRRSCTIPPPGFPSASSATTGRRPGKVRSPSASVTATMTWSWTQG